MAYKDLLNAIDKRLAELKLSERQACKNAGLSVDSIRNIRRGSTPRPETLAAIADALLLPRSYFNDLATSNVARRSKRSTLELENIYVRGAVQAGVWREAIEWEMSDWYPVTVPQDARFPGIERFGLEVRGKSMDLIYPEGTIVICIRFADLGRLPKSGERVICLRRSKTSEYEATIKEYDLDANGRHILWPRSSLKEYKNPIIIAKNSLTISDLKIDESIKYIYDLPNEEHAAEIFISSLVTSSVRVETI